MFFIEFLFAMIFSFIVVAFFTMAGSKGPWNNLGTLFLVVLLVTWAGGVWISPVGPTLFGAYWLPFFFMAALLALLLLNLIPHKDVQLTKPPEEELEKKDSPEIAAIATLGIAFWIFVCALIAGIALAYIV